MGHPLLSVACFCLDGFLDGNAVFLRSIDLFRYGSLQTIQHTAQLFVEFLTGQRFRLKSVLQPLEVLCSGVPFKRDPLFYCGMPQDCLFLRTLACEGLVC